MRFVSDFKKYHVSKDSIPSLGYDIGFGYTDR